MGRRSAGGSLYVTCNGQHLGRLIREPGGAVYFTYDEEWLEQDDSFPVSLSLPLRSERYTGGAVLAVFDNLLPDSPYIRSKLAERVGAEGRDTYSLLEALGRDCVGALQFKPEPDGSEHTGEVAGQEISDSDIAKLLRDLHSAPLALGVPPSQKYESEGGPGFTDVVKLLSGSDRAIYNQETFLKAQISFYLLSATDGHAKNFSVFLGAGGRYTMTPLYDVMSTEPNFVARQIQRNQMKMAMCFGRGRHDRIDEICLRHFEETAELARLPNAMVATVIDELRDKWKPAADRTLAEMAEVAEVGDLAFAEQIISGFSRRLEKLK